MKTREFKSKIKESLNQFLQDSEHVGNFVNKLEELYSEERPNELESDLVRALDAFLTLAALYVADPELRKEEPSYLDEFELQAKAQEFLEKNSHLLEGNGEKRQKLKVASTRGFRRLLAADALALDREGAFGAFALAGG